ncbi:MAG: VOC family protein [Bifidobacteriaceae bacterium]|jgi:predicted enzyme related to lactoylglutathione lyase|nr:VOC family protein [Bifidobacteriaceae bacterium]
MTLSIGMVTLDTTDPRKIGGWWAEQTGGALIDEADGWFVMVNPPNGTGPALGFQKVDQPTPGKNRLHLDFSCPDHDAEAARLQAAGASIVARHDGPFGSWTVLTDPDGNHFCVTAAL